MSLAPPLPRRVRSEPAGQRAERSQEQQRRSPPRRVLSMLLTALVVVGTIYLWPARFGGSTRLVIVSGHSMEPTYDLGDIVVARDGRDVGVGDIVVFAVPEGEAKGMLIIHRIVDTDADGRFITQGDNRDTPDQWHLTDDDVVGTPLVRVPKGGLVVRFLQQWYVLAAILGLLAILLLGPRSNDDDDRIPQGLLTVEVPSTWRVGEWIEEEIPATVMAEAEAWLAQELERELTPAGR